MKKIFFLFIAASVAFSSIAQKTTEKKMSADYTTDADLSRWFIDVNALGGIMTQDPTTGTSTSGYLNGLNLNTGNLSFDKGSSFGFDAQIGYFFGPKCHWGVGLGFMYLSQQGDFSLDNYHVEYQATDADNDVYRQLITGNNVKESVKITNLNLPILLKYKYRFSKSLGFTADAGPVINLQMKNTTTMNGNFDYEAVYKYTGSDGTNGGATVYDTDPGFSPTSDLITRNALATHQPGVDINTLFQQQRDAGYNVGLSQKPTNSKSDVSYTTGSIGFLVRPALSWYLSDKFAFNFGVYYMYQSFKNDNVSNYALMNTNMEYSSSLNNVSSNIVQSFGGSVGVRFLFGKLKDTDGDGIPNKHDKCPDVWGLEQFEGCPDTDKDGIQDSEDSCRTVAGLPAFHGCPDSDGDGIPDKEDECPYEKGSKGMNGCPDRDGDGITDKKDACPDEAGLAKFKGCPDTDGDGISDDKDECPTVAGPASNNGCPLPPPPAVPLSTPILFETNKTVVQESSMPVLEVAVKTLADDANAIVVIHGHADSRGRTSYNKRLSLRRANAVKQQLVDMGADGSRIKVVGHGEKDPAASNDTEEGRAENRRAVMRLNVE